jgi:hypothetical protein
VDSDLIRWANALLSALTLFVLLAGLVNQWSVMIAWRWVIAALIPFLSVLTYAWVDAANDPHLATPEVPGRIVSMLVGHVALFVASVYAVWRVYRGDLTTPSGLRQPTV